MISFAAGMERIQQREPLRTFAKERRENAAGCEASAVSISAVDPVLPEMLVFIEGGGRHRVRKRSSVAHVNLARQKQQGHILNGKKMITWCNQPTCFSGSNRLDESSTGCISCNLRQTDWNHSLWHLSCVYIAHLDVIRVRLRSIRSNLLCSTQAPRFADQLESYTWLHFYLALDSDFANPLTRGHLRHLRTSRAQVQAVPQPAAGLVRPTTSIPTSVAAREFGVPRNTDGGGNLSATVKISPVPPAASAALSAALMSEHETAFRPLAI